MIRVHAMMSIVDAEGRAYAAVSKVDDLPALPRPGDGITWIDNLTDRPSDARLFRAEVESVEFSIAEKGSVVEIHLKAQEMPEDRLARLITVFGFERIG